MPEEKKKNLEKELHDRWGCVPETSNCTKAGTFVSYFICRVCGKEWRG